MRKLKKGDPIKYVGKSILGQDVVGDLKFDSYDDSDRCFIVNQFGMHYLVKTIDLS